MPDGTKEFPLGERNRPNSRMESGEDYIFATEVPGTAETENAPRGTLKLVFEPESEGRGPFVMLKSMLGIDRQEISSCKVDGHERKIDIEVGCEHGKPVRRFTSFIRHFT